MHDEQRHFAASRRQVNLEHPPFHLLLAVEIAEFETGLGLHVKERKPREHGDVPVGVGGLRQRRVRVIDPLGAQVAS